MRSYFCDCFEDQEYGHRGSFNVYIKQKQKGQPMRRKEIFFLVPPCIFALLYCKLHGMAFKCTMSKAKKALGIQPMLKDSWQGAQRKNTALLLSMPSCLLHVSSFSHYSFCPLDKGELTRGSLSFLQSNSSSSPRRPITRLAAFVKQRHRG